MAGNASRMLLLSLVGAIVLAQAYAASEEKPVRFNSVSYSAATVSDPQGLQVGITLGVFDSQHSRQDLSGDDLWKMSVFGSKTNDPTTSDQLDFKSNVLSGDAENTPLDNGGDMTFDVTTPFLVSSMGGCEDDYKYVCMVFGKGDNPSTTFELYSGRSTCILLMDSCNDA